MRPELKVLTPAKEENNDRGGQGRDVLKGFTCTVKQKLYFLLMSNQDSTGS